MFHFPNARRIRHSILACLRSPETWVDGSLVNSVKFNWIQFNVSCWSQSKYYARGMEFKRWKRSRKIWNSWGTFSHGFPFHCCRSHAIMGRRDWRYTFSMGGETTNGWRPFDSSQATASAPRVSRTSNIAKRGAESIDALLGAFPSYAASGTFTVSRLPTPCSSRASTGGLKLETDLASMRDPNGFNA